MDDDDTYPYEREIDELEDRIKELEEAVRIHVNVSDMLYGKLTAAERTIKKLAEENAVLMASSESFRAMDAFSRIISRIGDLERSISNPQGHPHRCRKMEMTIADIERIIMNDSRGGNFIDWRIAKENPTRILRRLI